jgi:Ca2+-binding EF-hand superfamily protein
MPCDRIVRTRAERLAIAVPQGLSHEEIMKLTGAVGHDEAHEKLEKMSEEEFIEFVERMRKALERRRKGTQAYLESQGVIHAHAHAGVS